MHFCPLHHQTENTRRQIALAQFQWIDRAEAKHEYAIELLAEMPAPGQYDALVVAVAHDQFKTLGIAGLRQLANDRAIIYDIKGLFPKEQVDGRL